MPGAPGTRWFLEMVFSSTDLALGGQNACFICGTSERDLIREKHIEC